MNMSGRNTASDIDSEPHTLRSDLHGIPICKPPHLSSLFLSANPLQISQSPTRGFLTQEQKIECKMSGSQPCSANVNLQNKKSHCSLIPFNTSELSHTSQTGFPPSTFTETKSIGKEMLTSVGKSGEQVTEKEHKRLPPTEDVNISSCLPGSPSTELSHEPSDDTSFPDKINPVGTPLSNIASSHTEFVAPSTTAPSSDIPSSLKFFSFVILHVPEDEDEAMRVCEVLHNLEIAEGTTYCEGFETPGISPLKCLEDAVENSAYIVLLLTKSFMNKWGEFQTNTVLMNSIKDENKSGTIIPFYPKFKAPPGKLPLPLQSLTSLNEKSHLFEKQVQNTFKHDIIKRQQESWRKEQDLQTAAKSVEDGKSILNYLKKKDCINRDLQDVYAKISSMMSILQQQQPMLLGQGSVIHINNASNVQIGNQNSMNVQQSTNVPQMELSGEGHPECNNAF